MTTPQVSPDPLHKSNKLTPTIFINDPQSSNGAQAPTRTILLAFWMNAPIRAYTKYLAEYRRLAPTARIIFTTSASKDFLFSSSAKSRHEKLKPVVDVLRGSPTPVHIHMFSNGGVFATSNLLAAYRTAAGSPLPVSAIVIDSAPGNATISGAMRAFSFGLPKMWLLRMLSQAALFAFLVIVFSANALLRRRDAIEQGRVDLNDTSLIKGNPKRCYIYSDGDELVNWKHVEAHADEAEKIGLTVRREKFLGSPHVAHMRADPERYWAITKEYLDL